MARATGLEPATPGVTGRHSNQLSYARTAWKVIASKQDAFRGRSDFRNDRLVNGAGDGTRTRDLRRDRPAL